MNRKNATTYAVAVVGPSSIINGLAALGAQPHAADTPAQAYEVIRSLIAQTEEGTVRYAVIIVTEDILAGLSAKEYAAITAQVLPTIIAIPGTQGSQGFMRERLREWTIRAIGSDII